jgi:hypothetical protein
MTVNQTKTFLPAACQSLPAIRPSAGVMIEITFSTELKETAGISFFHRRSRAVIWSMKLNQQTTGATTKEGSQMSESDITRNITADCHQPMQKPEMIDSHPTDCCCDTCRCSESMCQDNANECEPVQQPSDWRKKMKTKLMPNLVNAAVVLSLIGILNIGAQANIIDPIDITKAADIQITDIHIIDEDINTEIPATIIL